MAEEVDVATASTMGPRGILFQTLAWQREQGELTPEQQDLAREAFDVLAGVSMVQAAGMSIDSVMDLLRRPHSHEVVRTADGELAVTLVFVDDDGNPIGAEEGE